MTRPPGDLVAPLPGATFDHDAGMIADAVCDLGRTRVAVLFGAVAVTTWDPADEWESTASAGAEHLVRALHDAGHLDAYRDRCEAAAWVRFDLADPATWPGEAVSVLFLVEGRMFVAIYDREAGVWSDGHTRYGVPCRHEIHWRPLPAGPVSP
jgi:hypothetical protein